MPRVRFGHCIGCDQPIRPPYLSFKVMLDHGDSITEWEEVDVCGPCAGWLTADDLRGLIDMPDEEEPTDDSYVEKQIQREIAESGR